MNPADCFAALSAVIAAADSPADNKQQPRTLNLT
jgi:hypothetical protein